MDRSPSSSPERRPELRHPEALQDFASRRVLEAILRGEIGPGARLSPTKIAAELDISHIPVREALAALEASGHVTRQPRVGFFVAETSLDDLHEVYHWRQVLEDEAHRLAMPRLEDDDIQHMHRLNLMAGKESAYSTRYLELNREFHFVAFNKAGSRTLLRFLNHLWDASLRHQNAMVGIPLPRTLLQEQHDCLIAAFRARDLDLVNRHMAEHRTVTIEAVSEIVADPSSASRAEVHPA
jgi:DNA-binding GntR family transcriptional regulator